MKTNVSNHPNDNSGPSRIPDINKNRRRLLTLAGLGLVGGATWDVVRGARDVNVDGPESRPKTTDEAINAYVRGCTDFGVDLLTGLVDSDANRNLMVSPLGLSGALAMAWAGARGETESQMARTLHFPYSQDRLHPAVGALQYDLGQRGRGVHHREVPEVWNVNRFELDLVNALWGQVDFPFATSFLDTLDSYYGSDLRKVNFEADPSGVRRRINRWAEQASSGYVEELVPPDAIDPATVFVLTNAVSLRADWQQPFDPKNTQQGEFIRPDGSTVLVPMMHQEGKFPVLEMSNDEAAGDVGYQMVELPYVSKDVSMVLAIPLPDRSLADLESVVDAAWLEARFAELDEAGPSRQKIEIPRFTFGNDLELSDQLETIGMTTAFEPGANFSGMTDPPNAGEGLLLDWVFHDTHVAVDEEGTVAVAVSGIGGTAVSAQLPITFDRPFLFCIRDRATDAVLFLGRVVDPDKD